MLYFQEYFYSALLWKSTQPANFPLFGIVVKFILQNLLSGKFCFSSTLDGNTSLSYNQSLTYLLLYFKEFLCHSLEEHS